MLNNRTRAFGLYIRGRTAQRLSQPPVPPILQFIEAELPPWNKRNARLLSPCFYLQRKKWKNMGTKTPAKILLPAHT
jgi:hypothetical protein